MIRYIYLVTVIKKVFLSLFTSLVKGTMMSTKTFTSHLLIKVENLQKKIISTKEEMEFESSNQYVRDSSYMGN